MGINTEHPEPAIIAVLFKFLLLVVAAGAAATTTTTTGETWTPHAVPERGNTPMGR